MSFKKKFFATFFILLFILCISIWLDIKTTLELGLVETICGSALAVQFLFWVTIFTDFECPTCGSWETTVKSRSWYFSYRYCKDCTKEFTVDN